MSNVPCSIPNDFALSAVLYCTECKNIQEGHVATATDDGEGLRERKRRETRDRITTESLRLFSEHGYEATTIDMIAANAGISRRTFFHYFASKDEVLLSLQTGLAPTLIDALQHGRLDQAPIDAMHAAMLRAIAAYADQDLVAIDRLMHSSEAIQSRKQAGYIRDEGKIFAALSEQYPGEAEATLRLVAMLGVNISRLSLDAWRSEGGKRDLADLVDEYFAVLHDLRR
jgi:AcrR family transcriptional regulator